MPEPGEIDRVLSGLWATNVPETAAQRAAAFTTAEAALEQERFFEAAQDYERWISLENGDTVDEELVFVLIRLAFCLHHSERSHDALDCLDRAEPLAKPLRNGASLAAIYALGAEILAGLGMNEAALRKSWRALAVSRSSGADVRKEAEALAKLAIAQGRCGHHGAALYHLEQARSIWQDLGDAHGIADCFRGVAEIRLCLGEAAEALSLALEAADIYDSIGKTASRMASFLLIGDAQRALGETDLARHAYIEGYRYWRTAGHRGWTRQFEERLYREALDLPSL